jgi:hypothetical protein
MKTHRKIIPIVALGLACGALAPASAPAASPLLSGYGGPGQGTQAILGSALLNGPSGGGGGSTGSGLASSATTSSAGQSGGGSSSGTRARRSAGHGDRSASRGAGASGGAYRSPTALSVTRASGGGSGVLGLSDSAFLVVLLVLAALMFTGLLTRGLARASWMRRHAGS